MKNNIPCFFTSFNKAYTGQAIVLLNSLRRQYGNSVHVVALLVDELDSGEEDYLHGFDEVLIASELDIPNFRSWIFGLNIIEAATAVKPFGLCHLLEKYEIVTYMDPDTVVYSRLDEIIESNEVWDITLTPHQTIAQTEDWIIGSTELESLRFGIYNLGFLSVRSTDQGRKIAKWWRDRCYRYCVIELERGLFTDQKIFDQAPALFSGVRILRHPGYNVATWNISERDTVFDSNKNLTVNGMPLRFCHFTKATHIGAHALDKMMVSSSFFEELFYSYVAQLLSKKIELRGLGSKWIYGYYSDGTVIDDSLRKSFRATGEARWKIRDPFSEKLSVENFVR